MPGAVIFLPQPPKNAMIKGMHHTSMADPRLALIDPLLHSANV